MLTKSLLCFLVATSPVQIEPNSAASLGYEMSTGALTVPIVVNGKKALARVNLREDYSYLNPDYVEDVKKTGEYLFADLEAVGVANRNFRFRSWSDSGIAALLGRDFFRESILVWDIPRMQLRTVSKPPVRSDSKSFKIDYSKGIFLYGEESVPLPFLSPYTAVPSGVRSSNAFELFDASSRPKALDKQTLYCVNLKNQLQVAFPRKGFDDPEGIANWEKGTYFTGSSFFGSQEIVIDFVSNSLSFKPDPQLNAVQLFGLRLFSSVEYRDGKVFLLKPFHKNSEGWFGGRGVVGMHFKKIGSILIDASRLSDFDYLLTLFRELDKGSSITFSDGTKDVVVG